MLFFIETLVEPLRKEIEMVRANQTEFTVKRPKIEIQNQILRSEERVADISFCLLVVKFDTVK